MYVPEIDFFPLQYTVIRRWVFLLVQYKSSDCLAYGVIVGAVYCKLLLYNVHSVTVGISIQLH